MKKTETTNTIKTTNELLAMARNICNPTKPTKATANKRTNTSEQKENAFALLLRTYETEYNNYINSGYVSDFPSLYKLAQAITMCVIKKCLFVGWNKFLQDTKNNLYYDIKNLENIDRLSKEVQYIKVFNKDGDTKEVINDSDKNNALVSLCDITLCDGLDLVNDAVIALLEWTEKSGHDTSKSGFIEKPFIVRELSQKVYIKDIHNKGIWQDVETTIIQQCFRAVRRSIIANRSLDVATNGYTYISIDSVDDESGNIDTIFYRLGKYADLGGYATDSNGQQTLYSASESIVFDIDDMIQKLNLSVSQAEILNLRLSGYGYKAIATFKGVRSANIQTQLKRIQEKAISCDFAPSSIKNTSHK